MSAKLRPKEEEVLPCFPNTAHAFPEDLVPMTVIEEAEHVVEQPVLGAGVGLNCTGASDRYEG